MADCEDDSSAAEGSPSLEGWLYQCDVSVWAALDLMLVQKATDRVQLEPATSEDVEAELAEHQPRVKSEIAIGSGELLVIQAKLRNAGHWTPSSLRNLAAHGKVRLSVNERLKDPRVRYVLVTSNGVNGKLTDLEVENFREQTELERLPTEVFHREVPISAAKRFVILSKQSQGRVRERIGTLLVESLRVPIANKDECIEKLRAEAIARMQSGYVWLRPDAMAVVKACGGADPHERATGFVRPTNWNDFVELLTKRSAVVIAGPSGTGKTTLANALSDHMAQVCPGLEIVHVNNEPAKISKRIRNPAPVLFHIEDPWGRYQSTNDQIAWGREFKALLHSASPSRLFVVTTRSDVLADAKGNWDFLDRWKVSLRDTDYGSQELRELFEIGLSSPISGGLKSAAINARDQILLKLTTPFEIDRFFKLLGLGPNGNDKTDAAFVQRVLSATQTDSIEEEVKTLVLTREAGQWAAVVWALMRALPTVKGEQLIAIRRAMHKQGSTILGSDTLLGVLLGGGYVKLTDDRYAFAHPKAEQGIKLAALKLPFDTEATMNDLVAALLSMPGHGVWSVPAAARIRMHWTELVENMDELPVALQEILDAWIDQTLAEELHDYEAMLRLAAAVGSKSSVGAECARWLQATDIGGDWFRRRWSRPSRDKSWYDKMRGDPLTEKVLRQFILTGLGADAGDFPKDFADELDFLSTGLDDAWRERALKSFPGSVDGNGDVIAYGAMRSPAYREELLDHAIAKDASPGPEQSIEEYWAERDGHNNEFGGYDDGDEDNVYLLFQAYVEAVRKDGWRSLQCHPRRDVLSRYWARIALNVPDSEITEDELLALLQNACGTDFEASTWYDMSRRKWRPSVGDLLKQRLINGAASARDALRIADSALAVAPEVLVDAMRVLIAANSYGRALDLAREAIVGLQRDQLKPTQVRKLRRLALQLPAPFHELVAAVVPRLKRAKLRNLSQAAAQVALQALPATSQFTRIALISHLAVDHPVAQSLARDLIFESAEPEPAEIGVELAAKFGWWFLVEQCLAHPRADVRQRAYQSLIDAGFGDRSALNLRMAADPGSRVRRAVVAAIKRTPSPEDVPALLLLAKDKWQADDHPYEHGDVFPIAREAAKCLASAGAIPADQVDELFELARVTKDVPLKDNLLHALADAGGEASLRRIARRVAMQKETRLENSAAKALAFTEHSAILKELDELASDYVLKVRPLYAPILALAIGRHGTAQCIKQAAKLIAAAIDHRVLLLPLALGAATEREQLAREILNQLPPAHAARTLIDLSDGQELPAEVLDDLGDIRVVNRVLDIIPNIAKRSRLTSHLQAA